MKYLLTRKNSTQLLIHILFWGLFIFVSLFVFTDYYWASNPFLQYLFLLLTIVYINYFSLLPYFVKKKWYFSYSLLFIGISFFATQLYCYVFTRCGCTIMKCLSDYLWQTIVPLLFFSFLWMLFKFIDEQEKVEKIKQEKTAMELMFLKSQINPHTLLNNLNTIYAYSIEKPEETPELILKLSENLKHILYDTNSAKTTLKKEMKFIENYIDFQRIRTQGTKTITYTYDTVNDNYLIAPLLLIIIIENAFKHSTINSEIRIAITIKNDQISLECMNYFTTKNSKNTNSIGLKNLRKRLQLIYPNKHKLNISKEANMYNVLLTINLN